MNYFFNTLITRKIAKFLRKEIKMTGKAKIEFDEMSSEEMRAREKKFNAFKEKWLRCERCGSYYVTSKGVKSNRRCYKCGFIMPPIPENANIKLRECKK
jgi:tRNA(Ile2) C34 agmatinyltransferase TiaS